MGENLKPHELPIVSSVAREPFESLPPLIDDARENPLVILSTDKGDVLVKSVAMPYSERHLLVLPDLTSHENLPSVEATPDVLLGAAFETAKLIADEYIEDPDLDNVEIGWNYSHKERKKRIASQPNNLHIHVVGYGEDDSLQDSVLKTEAVAREDLKTKVSEPLAKVATDLLYTQVLPVLENVHSDFFAKYFKVGAETDSFTLELKEGIDLLSDPEFSDFIKTVHITGQDIYNEIGRCFYQEENGKFVEGDDGRYAPLPPNERLHAIYEYIARHESLSSVSRRVLIRLAETVKPMSDVQNPTREMALKDFAYAAVFSGERGERGDFAWKFGFDPVVFSTRDVLQASRVESRLFERDASRALDEATLARVKDHERMVADKLLEDVRYKQGKAYVDLAA